MKSDDDDAKALQIAREIVRSQRDMQVATVSAEGTPWIFTCWYATVDDFKIIFMSKSFRRHSQDILRTPPVAATTVARKTNLGEPVQSITIEGECRRATAVNIATAYDAFAHRFPQVRVTPEDFLDSAHPDYLWIIEPQSIFLFDELNFPPPTKDPKRNLTAW